MRHLSTHHSWSGSVLIPERTWIHAHLRLQPNGNFSLKVALGNYDDRGGNVIDSANGRVAALSGPLELTFGDNYAGANSAVVIGEVLVRAVR